MFHVWRFSRRGNALFLVTGKRRERWDDSRVPAAWKTRSAAAMYARREGWDCAVRACEGERCGLGEHGELMVYRPADTIEVDWDDAGDYSHAAADVTDDRDSYEVRYGLDAELDDWYLLYASASGAMRLFSRDRKYDASNPGPALTAAQLQTPHLVRMRSTYVYGGATVVRERWEGIAYPPILRGRERTPVAEFELEGRHALALRARTTPARRRYHAGATCRRVGAALTPAGIGPGHPNAGAHAQHYGL